MACYTLVELRLDEDAFTRKARKKFGLPEKGPLSYENAQIVQAEAGVLRAMDQVRKLDPRAVIVRKGNELTVTVQR